MSTSPDWHRFGEDQPRRPHPCAVGGVRRAAVPDRPNVHGERMMSRRPGAAVTGTSPTDHYNPIPRTLLPPPGNLKAHHFAILVVLAATVSRGDGKYGRLKPACMPITRLAEIVGSWAGRRRSDSPSPMQLKLLRQYLREIQDAGVGQVEIDYADNLRFTWRDPHLSGLQGVGGVNEVWDDVAKDRVRYAGGHAKLPKAIAWDPTLTGRQKLTYAALWWAVFHFRGVGRGMWQRGVYVSQSSLLPEWTGLRPRQIGQELRDLENARLIVRRPDRTYKHMPLITFVPVSVRYVRHAGLPPGRKRKEVPLYRLVSDAERELRFQFWCEELQQQSDLPGELWDATWGDPDTWGLYGDDGWRTADDGSRFDEGWGFVHVGPWLEERRRQEALRRHKAEAALREQEQTGLEQQRHKVLEQREVLDRETDRLRRLEQREERERLAREQEEAERERQRRLEAELDALLEDEEDVFEDEDPDEVARGDRAREAECEEQKARLAATLKRLREKQLAGR